MFKSKTNQNTNTIAIISIAVSIIIFIVGIIVNFNLQSRMEALEITNRTQVFRPLILLKDSVKAFHIKSIRDTTWLNPKYDYYHDKNSTKKIHSNQVSMFLKSDFLFSLVNESEQIADVLGWIFFDTTSAIPRTFNEIYDRIPKGDLLSNEKISELPIQLNHFDIHQLLIEDHTVQHIESNTFYLHLIVFYSNQVGDYYYTYFVVKGREDETELKFVPTINEERKILFNIGTIYYKDSHIRLESQKPLTKFLEEEKRTKFEELLLLKSDQYTKRENEGKKLVR